MIDTFSLLSDLKSRLLAELGEGFPLDVYTEISELKEDAREFVVLQLTGDGNELVEGNQTRRVPCSMKMKLPAAAWEAGSIMALVTRTSQAMHAVLRAMRGPSPGGGYYVLDASAGLPVTGTDGLSWMCALDFTVTVQF